MNVKTKVKMGATTILISNNQKSPMVNTSNFFYYINAGEEKVLLQLKLCFIFVNNTKNNF